MPTSQKKTGLQPVFVFFTKTVKEVVLLYSVGEYEHDAFSIDVVTDKQGILYWSDGFDEGWQAHVNGKEATIYRANVNFKAIVLRAGSSHIDFVYQRPLFKMALLAFYGTLGLAIILAFTTRLFADKRIVS